MPAQFVSQFAVVLSPIMGFSTNQTAVAAVMMAALVVTLMLYKPAHARVRANWEWVKNLALGTEPPQRILCLRYLIGAANCVAGVAALNFGVRQGVINAQESRLLTIAAIATLIGFYVLMRSGLNKSLPDPSMKGPLAYTTVLFLAWGYLIGGPAKPVALLLLFMVLLFGMFVSNTRMLVRASALAALAFGVVMWRTALHDQATNAGPQVQLVYFCVLLVMLASVCVMVNELTKLRAKSTKRKLELTDALSRIQELATRDELTGLFNRRHMLERLNTEKHRCNRSGRTFCVGMIDVDHFKNVNDLHGHGVGDQVLSAVATVITAGLRETDVVARWGGEEFLVMFTDTDCATAEQVLTRIKNSLRHTVVCPGVPDLRVSFSAGVTRYQPDELLTRTVDRSDRALYMAKAAGRSSVMRLEPDHKIGLIA